MRRLRERFATGRLGLIFVLAVYSLAAALTWRKWPDVLTDFGSQLYLPWRIASGEVLYLDINYLTGGPLSQHYHALLLRIFGISMLPVFISNLVLGFGLLILLYQFFSKCADVWTVTLIGLGVALVFAFNQYSNIGNFNFIAPYCHEVWHGVVLSILAVGFLARWVSSGKWWLAAAAGFCGGLVFMTKPEVFMAFMAAAATAAVLIFLQKGTRVAWRGNGGAIIGGLVGPAVMLLWFHRVESWSESVSSVAFAWVPLLKSSVSHEFFYRWVMGLDAPLFHLRMMLVHVVVLVAVLGVCAFWFRKRIDTSAKRLITFGLIAGLVALASGMDWVDCGRSLPVLVAVLCVVLWRMWKEVREIVKTVRVEGAGASTQLKLGVNESAGTDVVFPLLFAVFALFLLAKLGFYSRIWHYGFALAMPAFCAAIYLLHWILPRWLERLGVNRRLFRGTIGLLLLIGFLRLFVQSQIVYAGKTVAVGSGPDKVRTFNGKVNPAGPAIQTALAWMSANMPPESTLAVLPEGVMVNYLSRHVNPTRYLVWNPAEIASFGQENMTAAFQNHPPDFVMLIHRDASEYGAKYFGQEKRFGGDFIQWIENHYEPVCLIGSEPLRTSEFGIKIFRRKSFAGGG
jgi:hypothetical protein